MTKDEELIERAANIAYRVCAETRHVTLGDKAANAIRAELRPADRLKALAQPVVGVERLRRATTLDAQTASNAEWTELLAAALDVVDLAASPSPVVGDREALQEAHDAIDQALDDMGAQGHCVCPEAKDWLGSARTKAANALSTPVVGGIKDALGQTLTLIDDLYREYGIALNDEHVAVARHARGVWLDAPDPHTTDRAGMAQEVENR